MAYKKYCKEDQRELAIWAVACAERVLHFFEEAFPNDGRPRLALQTCTEWIHSGIFQMSIIRAASLGAHAAAKEAKANDAACFAARAAGQAVATAHVTQHAYGSAYYALKALAVRYPLDAATLLAKELDWQSSQLPGHLRQEIMARLIIQKSNKKSTGQNSQRRSILTLPASSCIQ